MSDVLIFDGFVLFASFHVLIVLQFGTPTKLALITGHRPIVWARSAPSCIGPE
jgi:hypothetical protein